MNRPRLAVLAVLVAVVGVALVVAGLLALRDDDRSAAPAPTDEKAPAALARFYDQKPRWTSCGDNRCTWVTVPLDYAKPAGRTIRLRVVDVPATDAEPKGRLVVNPGGPGGSGLEYAPILAGELSKKMRAAYDVVGFDPRGVGASTPVECLDAAELDAWIDADPTPDDAAEVAAMTRSNERLGRGCVKNSGALASHVSTHEAARDMDILRAMLGEERLDYYGASYGTQLGATYAHLFPQRVGRLVLDGAIDPTSTTLESAMGQNEGFERALTAYLESCTSSASCPLGDDVDVAQERLATMLQRLDEKPLTAGSRKLTESRATYGMAVTLYNKSSWPYLTTALDRLADGDARVLLQLSDAYFDRQPDGSYKGNEAQAFPAISCLDSRSVPSVDDVEAAVPRFEKVSPVFGRFMAWGMRGCAEWPVESATPQGPVTAAGADPILVVGTTRDPATPYEWAGALAEQLESGVLLTREGDGHTGYTSGDRCTQKAVDAYLIDGTVPKDGATCRE